MKVTRIDGLSDRKRSGIFEHVFSNQDREVAGVLIGQYFDDGTLWVVDHIPAEAADEQVAAVTFTHESWDRILRIKDIDFAELEIIGWYHSHPGYGLFLSGDDMFMHRNFFPAWWQIAYVIDPVNEEGGIFVWSDSEMEMFDRHEASRDGAGISGLGSFGGDALSVQAVRDKMPQELRFNGLLGVGLVIAAITVLLVLLGLLVIGAGSSEEDTTRVVPTQQGRAEPTRGEEPVEVIDQFPESGQTKPERYVPEVPGPTSSQSKGSRLPGGSQSTSGGNAEAEAQGGGTGGGVTP